MSESIPPPAAPPRRLRIFLCHASVDKPAVRDLYRRLRADGFQPWIDEEDLIAGEDWEPAIRRAVREADVVVVCLTVAAATQAGYRHKEIGLALNVADEQPPGTIYIIPLRLEACDVPERLSRWHWVNLYEERGYERLVRGLSLRARDLGRALPQPSALADQPTAPPEFSPCTAAASGRPNSAAGAQPARPAPGQGARPDRASAVGRGAAVVRGAGRRVYSATAGQTFPRAGAAGGMARAGQRPG